MAIAFEIGICDLLTEFLADALEFFGFGYPTGAVSVLHTKSLFDPLNYLFIGI